MIFDRSFPKDDKGKPMYQFLETYTRPVKKAEREIVGRQVEKERIMAAMQRPELSNIMLLAEAGSGKTALVQGLMLDDVDRYYLEVDLSHMIADLVDKNQMADKLKSLFNETQLYCRTENVQIVLFIDEFHQIVELSPAAVEALKPLLADSGTRGIRVIAATTFVEFRKWISPNQPLVERLQRINLEPPSKEMVVQILRGMARRYGVEQQFYNDMLFEDIYDLTNRYIPANAQPRKSILVLDAMVGWYRYKHRRIDRRLLADVIYESEGVNIAFRVDATKIKHELDAHVYAQELASTIIQDRLQICVADLNDKTKPMSSFLFCGSTGVGKSQDVNTPIPVYTADGSVAWKLAGEVREGDYLFDRNGHPTKVLGIFPQGKLPVYLVTLGDGRTLRVSGNHLWSVVPAKRSRIAGLTVYSTEDLIKRGLETNYRGHVGMKYFIPMNQPVEWPAQDYEVDPYVVGAFIGDGKLRDSQLMMSSGDDFIVKKISGLLGKACKNTYGYDWAFITGEVTKTGCDVLVQTKDVFGHLPELYNQYSVNRRIPACYMTGSIEQRWALVQGLFDTDGTICQADGDRFNVSFATNSEGLAHDVQNLLYSLGVSSSISVHNRSDKKNPEYDVHVAIGNSKKENFFSLPRKREIAIRAKDVRKQREKSFDFVGIRSIEPLDEEAEMVCFYVENWEHLYQAGQFIVTHNTVMAKQLAQILFNDSRRLIRFDMTEYANENSLDSFRHELTNRVWERPYSIILLDEIEKACAPVTRLLLQVLDDGRLTDENNREVPFINSYIVLTTNAGNEVFKDIAQYASSDTGSGENLKKYQKIIRKSISSTTGSNRFPPELLGRIDCIVPFQPLSENTQAMIVKQKLMELSQQVKEKHGVQLQIRQRVIEYIVKDNLDTESDAGGARAVISKLESEVVTAVARAINEYGGKYPGLLVDYEGDPAYTNKHMLESSAHIVVKPVAGNNAAARR